MTTFFRSLKQSARGYVLCLISGTLAMLSGVANAEPDITVTYTPQESVCCSFLNMTISADARYAAYKRQAVDTDIFLYDLVSGEKKQINLTPTGGLPVGARCDAPSISADGRYVVFGCLALAMGVSVPGNGAAYFIYDRINHKTEMIPILYGVPVINSINMAISADGHYVAYRAIDPNGVYRLFIRNMVNKTTQVTDAKSVFPGAGARMTFSTDGRYIAYDGRAVAGSAVADVAVYDIATGITDIVSLTAAGIPSTKGGATVSMSDDGNIVAFLSADLALVSPPVTAGGVFVRDRSTGKTEYISAAAKAGFIAYPHVSGNGRYVTYVGNSQQTVKNLYVYDRLTKLTRIVPGAISGSVTSAVSPRLSRDGRYVAFEAFVNSPSSTKSIGLADLGVAAGLSVPADMLSVVEGGAAGTYTLALTQVPSANVSVAISPDQQLTVERSQLTFTPDNWNVPQVVRVWAVQDGKPEGAHTGVVTHTVASADVHYSFIQPSTFTVSITDGVTPTIVIPATAWSQLVLPLTGTAAPGATVIVTAFNRSTGWLSAVTTVADSLGRWAYSLSGFTDGVIELDAQADGIKSVVRTVTVTLSAMPPKVIDVTGYIRTTAYGLIYNRSTGKYAGDFVLTNTGSIKLSGPLHLQFDNLTAGVTLSNATGAHEGAPFITVPGGLEPDQSVTIPLLFDNPSRGGIGYDAKIYSGTF